MSQASGLLAVVPVAPFATAKRRLAAVLRPAERRTLASAMLADVLSALRQVSSLAGIVVVTSDADATAAAQTAGAQVLVDPRDAGTGPAVAEAARWLADRGACGMIVIPSDVPLITPADVSAILAAHREAPAVTLVPASIDGGTNALAASPPQTMGFRFGADSFRLHRESARSEGIEAQVVQLARLGCDLDRPADLLAFAAHPSATRSYAYLAASGVAERLLGDVSARGADRLNQRAHS